MKFTSEKISPLLREYGISNEITGLVYYTEYSDKDTVKIIARVDVANRPPLVIKLLRDPLHPHEVIERQCEFSEHLRRNGISTPERYSKGGEYCIERTVCGERVDVTLEDWCGDGLKNIDLVTAAEAGRLLARMHRISFRDNFKIGAKTRYNAIGKNVFTGEKSALAGGKTVLTGGKTIFAAGENVVSGIDKFRELAKKGEESQYKSVTYPHRLCKKPELLREIIDIYDQKIANAAALWDRLPCSAVQSGIVTDNLTRRDGILTVFNYNNAGDETLISDLILEGLYMAYEAGLAKELTDADRPLIFMSFLNGYRRVCPLTHDERIAACELYPAVNALWFSRISDCGGAFPDSLEAVMMSGDCDKADEILTHIYGLITDDARKIFASELFNK